MLKATKPGDTIMLAAGTYSNLKIWNVDAGGVTIKSADPKNPAVITDLNLRYSSGITISDVKMAGGVTNVRQGFLTANSNDIHFDHVEVYGPPNLGAANEIAPFGMRWNTNVSVTNSVFHDLKHGIGLGDNTGVVISGNSFEDIRTDGVRGGGNSEVLIEKNFFTNFTPAAGDHADAIQLWTTGRTESAEDITISGNIVLRGEGAPIQGVFIRDQVGTLPFKDVTITNNLVLGGNYNGIAINGANGAVITGNTVAGQSGDRSWVRVDNGTDVVVKNNTSTFFMTAGADKNGALADNTLIRETSDGGAVVLHDFLNAHADLAALWGGGQKIMASVGMSYAAAAAVVLPEWYDVVGTARNDKLEADIFGNSRLYGGAGNDSLTGSNKFDTQLIGGAGDDTYLIQGLGDEIVEETDGGTDTVATIIDYTMAANVENMRVKAQDLLVAGNDLGNRIIGSSGTDTINGMGGDDLIQGVDGDDEIRGGQGNDDLRGDGGDDKLFGDAGNDTLIGGLGNDTLYGGVGNDLLEAGAGSDTMTGGAGNDTFRFRADTIKTADIDVILDFTRGQDKLDLRFIDAKIATSADDAFTLIGTNAFHKKAGELRYTVKNGIATVTGDVDGDGLADFTIQVHGVSALAASDFVL